MSNQQLDLLEPVAHQQLDLLEPVANQQLDLLEPVAHQQLVQYYRLNAHEHIADSYQHIFMFLCCCVLQDIEYLEFLLKNWEEGRPL